MGDIDFKVISAAENSNKSQKTRFWKEKSVEDMVTLGPSTGHTSRNYGQHNQREGAGINICLEMFGNSFHFHFMHESP